MIPACTVNSELDKPEKARAKRQVQVTVIIPTYNRANTIERAIRSVLSQELPGIEIVVVDDGSSDDTKGVIENLRDDRVHYLFQPNAGAPRARNRGLDAATGKFVAFLDSDDYLLPMHLARSLEVLRTRKSTCVYAPVIVDRGSVSFTKPRLAYDNASPISEYLLCGRGFVPTSTLILPAVLARQVRYDEELKFGQDIDFAIRLVRTGARLVMLEEPGAVWHDAKGQGRVSSAMHVDNRLAWLERTRSLLTERAFLADCGWHVAKGLARQGEMGVALRHYANAVLSGAYEPRLAIAVLLQIVLPQKFYRPIADALIRLKIRP